MKNLLLIPVFLFGTLYLHAQNSIEVEIDNFKSDKGLVLLGLYNTEASFLETPFKGEKVKISGGKATFTFTNIPDGTYAITLIHDEDKNDELTKNFLGIPKEGYGASNDAPANFGPPKWKDAKFEISNGETVKQKIRLRHF
ncbi:DUF2141 domain-containing protein [Antarcticibacterium sp. 1MA-6-2]|uniref:DUF2141 domain-containing protein n=1 Tax=Antarcticibacterium sp. 1MA-6-2 TaxID=2908210 RepID=UPI001F44DA2E|nr:DUF2141 domain-containing protein [Antarcticibacterium sp. 1MA-6-2]UJH92794.1 DUF2141 domain-containing protein [Antarcticibacterium sp. 1MA-6-2]